MATDRRKTLELVGPEGVPLRFEPAMLIERVFALGIDLVVIGVTFAFIAFVSFYAVAVLGLIEPLALTLVAIFVLRFGYFTFFELRWQGATPGKRLMNIKVVSRDGTGLTTEAVVARNLMRDVELLLPLQVLANPEQLFGDLPWWLITAAVLWLALVLLLPFYAKERVRVGDVVGGTLVVRVPRSKLAVDEASRATVEIRFTPKQLSVYGERELETLRALLVDFDDGRATAQDLLVVARTIASRIGFSDDAPSRAPVHFLRAFYKAQRATLEKGLLFGKRKASKNDPS
ncbi:MAG: RDD family protein [Myxococcota bacterium]